MWQSSVDPEVADGILRFAVEPSNGLWHRRMGVVPFLDWYKHRLRLPLDFGHRLVDACEANLLASPHERFTQTGIAWVLRYTLVQPEKDYAASMVYRHGGLWTKEAKKSLVEKLPTSSAMRNKILKL